MTGSLWWEPIAANAPTEPPRPPPYAGLPGSADVVIVGGGFTGLWTAYYLLSGSRGIEVAVLEAEHVGFGASGRNGGWVSALWPVSAPTLAARYGRQATRVLLGQLRSTVVEVGDVALREGIHCGFDQGGRLVLARSAAQAARGRDAAAEGRDWGDGTVWIGADEARERLCASHVRGATFNPHCARIHPRLLLEGLAAAVRRRGGLIVEGCRVADASPGSIRLEDGRLVRAGHVIRATEAYTARLSRLRRRIAPVYSLMVATEPLSAATWDSIGLARREVFADHRHVTIYGQRTLDDRIAFGGRGAPYHWGSAIHQDFDRDERVFGLLRAALIDLLPQLGSVTFTHAWGGPLGIARDWHPSVGYEAASGVGWAGGYVGDGLAASNLAGRTLADLVLNKASVLTGLPWVGHRSPQWEPEPLRWLGVNAGLRVAELADREERATGRPARLGRLLNALVGH